MELKIGDTVEIINVEGIELANLFFKNGDVTEIVDYKGYLALFSTEIVDADGLIIFPEEYKFIKKVDA